MRKRFTYTPETDAAIFALRRAGWRGPQIAAAFGISAVALEHHLGRLKRAGSPEKFKNYPKPYKRVRPEDQPIEGEQWVDVPARGLAVSSEKRVKSLRSGYLIKQHIEAQTGRPAVNFETKEKRGTIAVVNLMREAAGLPRSMAWRKPRSPKAQPWEPDPTSRPVRLTALHLEAANKAVPTHLSPEMREDLVQDVLMMWAEGFSGDGPAAYTLAKRRHFRLFNTLRDRSLDAPVRPGEDRRLIDTIPADRPHW